MGEGTAPSVRASPYGLGLLAAGAAAGVAGVLLVLSMAAPPRPETPDQPGTLEANGLRLQIQNSGWITHDEVGGPTPASIRNGFDMPASMMPGMPAHGTERLFLEVVLSDVGGETVRFTPLEFSVRAPDGSSWRLNHPASFGPGALQPGQGRSLDLFFDIPDGVTRLQLAWDHDGRLQSTPIDARPPPPHIHP
jgi:hypothetical protein